MNQNSVAVKFIQYLKKNNVLCVVYVCFALAYTALLPQFYLMYDRINRVAFDWNTTTKLSILLSISAVALVYMTGYVVLIYTAKLISSLCGYIQQQALVQSISAWYMFIIAARSAMAIIYSSSSGGSYMASLVSMRETKIIFYAILPLAMMFLFRVKCGTYCVFMVKLYAIAGIMLILFVWQSSRWDNLPQAVGAQSVVYDKEVQQLKNSLYIFMFDEWSYPETFGSYSFNLTNMPNLSSFMETATVYHNAYSPSITTYVSVPRFFFQSDYEMHKFSYDEILNKTLSGRSFPKMKTIFCLGSNHYRLIVGSVLHYEKFMNNYANTIVPFYSSGANTFLGEKIVMLLGSQLAFMRYFGVNIQAGNKFKSFEDWQKYHTGQMQSRIRPVLKDILPRLPARNIAFFHMMLPHSPFKYYRDWTPRNNVRKNLIDKNCYLENVYAMDMVIADIVRILQARNDYDSSMIVFLSDHGKRDMSKMNTWYKWDDMPEADERHVPLIIKHPEQDAREDNYERICITELHTIFEDYLKGHHFSAHE